jgi:protein-L-isoaspartate O-methyltransferase
MALPQTKGGYAALVRQLDERGLLSPQRHHIWTAVPRHLFVPQACWTQLADRCEPVEDTEAWWALVTSDEPVVVQVDDGADDGPGIATSSNSKPSMVAKMLELLRVHDGHRVLEVGTATGYVAALLSARIGEKRVYSIELDPAMARLGEHQLREAGYAPHLRVGDGAAGWPEAAPFDGIISTCALRQVPYLWVQQLRLGGTLVLPLHRDFWSGMLVRLTAQPDGSARGRFHGGASYMLMRSQRAVDEQPVDGSTGRQREASVDPAKLLDHGFALYASAALPGVSLVHAQAGNELTVWARHVDGSAAVVTRGEQVREYGERPLWRQIEQAYQDWRALGSPALARFGLTVTPTEQAVWLDDPTAVVPVIPDGTPDTR